MPKSGAAAAQMCPGFQPRADIATYSLRAMKILTAMRARVMGRAEEVDATANAMFVSSLKEVKSNPVPGVADAWTFTLGLKEVGDVKVPIEGDAVDVVSADAVKEMVTELDNEGTLKANNVGITGVEQTDNYTLVMTVNVLGA